MDVECNSLKIAREFLFTHDWPNDLKKPFFDRCYCKSCFAPVFEDTNIAGGQAYVIPRGYTRIGVRIDEAYAKRQNIWRDWTKCYYGTSVKTAKTIIEHGMLMLPEEESMDSLIGNNAEEVPFFTTPSTNYASLPMNASTYKFRSPTDRKNYEITVVLQCKQKPDSFVVQQTVAAGARSFCPFIKNEEIEWKTVQRDSVVPYGMLMLVKEQAIESATNKPIKKM